MLLCFYVSQADSRTTDEKWSRCEISGPADLSRLESGGSVPLIIVLRIKNKVGGVV